MLLDLRPHVEDAETTSVRARVRASWRYIKDSTTLRGLLLTQAVALAFFEFSPPIEVAYAKVSLHAGDSGYGILLGVWGLGVAIGSIVFARSIKRSLGILLSASTLAVGLAYLGWAIAPTLALACVAGLIGGIGNGVQWAALISAVQRLTPQYLQGRMMGAVESIGAISPGIGLALGGTIAALSSPRAAFLVAGIGASLCTIAFVRLPLGRLTCETAVARRNGGGAPSGPPIAPRPVRRAHLKDHTRSAVKYYNGTTNEHDRIQADNPNLLRGRGAACSSARWAPPHGCREHRNGARCCWSVCCSCCRSAGRDSCSRSAGSSCRLDSSRRCWR